MMGDVSIYYYIALVLTLVVVALVLALRIVVRNNDENAISIRNYKGALAIVLVIYGGLPIITYPAVLIANLMSSLVFIATLGAQSIHEFISALMMILLIITSTVYPIIYIICMIIYFRKNSKKRIITPLIPICILVLIVVLSNVKLNNESLYDTNGNYKFSNVRIFEDTPVWDLAKAVKDENVKKIQEITKAQSEIIDYQESEYGASLLIWAVGENKYKSVEALLMSGADPNISYEKGTPLLALLSWFRYRDSDENAKMIELLLSYGADPSYVFKTTDYGGDYIVYKTPLVEAIKNDDIETIKILVENGADINYRDEFGITPSIVAIRWAVNAYYRLDSEIIDYLILENNADLSGSHSYTVHDQKEGIYTENVGLLREWIFEVDSPEYLKKLEYIKKFEECGQVYHESEVKPYLLDDIKEKYPEDWEEYLEVY